MQFELNAQTRTLQGTGASRRLRRSGKVPGIVYGGEGEPMSIELEHNPLLLALRNEAFHSSLISRKFPPTPLPSKRVTCGPSPYSALSLTSTIGRGTTL